MRLFYAIEFTDQVKQELAEISRSFSAAAVKGRWTRPENLHLTLQFLGEQPPASIPELTDILQQAAASVCPFNMCIQGCGTFGHARNAQDILWLGVEVQPQLQSLVARLNKLLRQMKYACDERPFSPHITLGRQVQINPSILNGWHHAPVICPVRSLTLMESLHINERLVYQPVKQATLSRSQPDPL
jgi:RNA 2',3'-cyclic 3'-phosphodiesterase